jgi:predicted HAD superfamily Cof-like phosphohydrolase
MDNKETVEIVKGEDNINRLFVNGEQKSPTPEEEAELTAQKTNFEDVTAFHKKFGIDGYRHGQLTKLDGDVAMFRVGFLQEELTEFVNGWSNNDLEKMIDSLIDLVYVAMGTANLMGVSPRRWQDCWDEVQRANMSKTRKPSNRSSTRGHSLDVVKPDGWVGPKTFVGPEWELPSLNPREATRLRETIEIAVMREKLFELPLTGDDIKGALAESAIERAAREAGVTVDDIKEALIKP